MQQLRIIISGGGTGGHIFPAVAIANALKSRFPQSEILFVGAKNRMEMERVPAAGYKIVGLDIAGFDRKNLLKNISVLWKLQKSLREAKKIIKNFNPQIAIGVGGFASGPTLKMANRLNIPTLLQEQNSYAGVTNKLLGKQASKICVAYEGMSEFFQKDKIVLTGNPCRQDLLNPNLTLAEAVSYFGLDAQKKTILIIGGSLGARTINNSILNHIDTIRAHDEIQIIWQCGGLYHAQMQEKLAQAKQPSNLHLFDFISRMDLAYTAAHLVVSRAGAGSISELSLLRKPTILVPSPNVSEDHQTKNAMALVNKNAAQLVTDTDASEKLLPVAIELVKDIDKLNTLSQNIVTFAQHNSADRIVDEIMQIIDKQ